MSMKLIFCAAAALLTFAAIPVLAKRGEKFGKKRAYIMILCSALFFSSLFAGAEEIFTNSEWGSGGQYAAEITPDASSFILPLDGTGEITLNVRNRGSFIWDSASAEEPVHISWHLLSERGAVIRFDNPRTDFSRVIKRGDSESVTVRVSPAAEGIPAGRYIIEFDLVREGVAWFADRGSATCRVRVEVRS